MWNRLSPPGRHRQADGFTMVEIVMAMGIFTFALIGVVLLLGNALRSSSETQRDSALASIVASSAAAVRALPTNTVVVTNYFSLQGSMVSNTNEAAYITFLNSVGSGLAPTNLDYWTGVVVGPLPATNVTGRFLYSRLKE